ncbi:uncharacterized protein LOC128163316 [Crassostrea angulata]|uniref:uncharacterized protein LOC128163316 n=1 Tax=Magallana angulata TaxID=2784310 RepID=UPI0022B1B4DA|nr:uncharacterized protein LOC128163316 [Crassostrea angulata]
MKEFAYHTHLPSYKEVIIQSPGYPNKNYSRDTTYKWLVTAPYTTEEILIKIKIDIQKYHVICEDYLQIEEANSLTGNFQVFKQCGMLEINRTTQGHRLLIKLVSNNDHFTSKGFELKLKVIKIRPTTYKSLPTTAITSQKISSEASISAPLTTTSTVMLSTSFDTHTCIQFF